jgi:hypothetical protein
MEDRASTSQWRQRAYGRVHVLFVVAAVRGHASMSRPIYLYLSITGARPPKKPNTQYSMPNNSPPVPRPRSLSNCSHRSDNHKWSGFGTVLSLYFRRRREEATVMSNKDRGGRIRQERGSIAIHGSHGPLVCCNSYFFHVFFVL